MDKLLIRNISEKEVKLSYISDNVELKVLLKPNEVVIADNNKTSTMSIFETRGFIQIETANNDSIQEATDKMLENISKNLKEEEKTISIIKKELQSINIPEEIISEPIDVKIGKWTDDEVKFLKKNYPKYGRNYCVEKLNRTTAAVQSKIDFLGLKKKK